MLPGEDTFLVDGNVYVSHVMTFGARLHPLKIMIILPSLSSPIFSVKLRFRIKIWRFGSFERWFWCQKCLWIMWYKTYLYDDLFFLLKIIRLLSQIISLTSSSWWYIWHWLIFWNTHAYYVFSKKFEYNRKNKRHIIQTRTRFRHHRITNCDSGRIVTYIEDNIRYVKTFVVSEFWHTFLNVGVKSIFLYINIVQENDTSWVVQALVSWFFSRSRHILYQRRSWVSYCNSRYKRYDDELTKFLSI